MNKIEAEALLHGAIDANLRTLGFQEAEHLFYLKPRGEVAATLGIGGSLTDTGCYKFGYVAGVRFSKLEELLSPDEVSRTKPTIIVPHHFFEEKHAYNDWSFSTPTEVASQVESMLNHISKYALGFWDSVTSVAELQNRICDKSFSRNLVLDNTQRICLQVAILFVLGQKNDAIELLRNALLERKNDLPKKRRALEKLASVIGQ